MLYNEQPRAGNVLSYGNSLEYIVVIYKVALTLQLQPGPPCQLSKILPENFSRGSLGNRVNIENTAPKTFVTRNDTVNNFVDLLFRDFALIGDNICPWQFGAIPLHADNSSIQDERMR